MKANNINEQQLTPSGIYDLCAPAMYGKIVSIVHNIPIADRLLEKVFIEAFKQKSNLPQLQQRPLVMMVNQARDKSARTVKALQIFNECCAGRTIAFKDENK